MLNMHALGRGRRRAGKWRRGFGSLGNTSVGRKVIAVDLMFFIFNGVSRGSKEEMEGDQRVP